jgi:hypothetical protein
MLSAIAQPQPCVICHTCAGTESCLQITKIHASSEWKFI